ncbi:hypothetical protein CHS0354_015409, partial [Potamilus streckersoni]
IYPKTSQREEDTFSVISHSNLLLSDYHCIHRYKFAPSPRVGSKFENRCEIENTVTNNIPRYEEYLELCIFRATLLTYTSGLTGYQNTLIIILKVQEYKGRSTEAGSLVFKMTVKNKTHSHDQDYREKET